MYLVLTHTRSHNAHLIQVRSVEWRIYNSAVELLDLQVPAVIAQRGKKVFSASFLKSGKRYFPAQTQQRGKSPTALRDSSWDFFFTTSVFLPSGHLSLIPVATVIRYVNDPSLSQTQQINQGQWVPFSGWMGRRGGET